MQAVTTVRNTLRNVLVVCLSVLLSAGYLVACDRADPDYDSKARYEYSVSANSFDLGFSGFVIADTSYSDGNAYLLLTAAQSADEDGGYTQKTVIVDRDMDIIHEIPCAANTSDLHVLEVKASADGSYWTVEAPKTPGSAEWYLKHYDEYGNLLLSVRPGDIAEDTEYGFSIAAINSAGQVYVTIDSGRTDTARDRLALIDQNGALLRYWNEFTYQLSVALLDDDTPIVRVIPEAQGAAPNRKSDLYEIMPDGSLALLGDVGDLEADVDSNGFQPWMFAGNSREIFFEGNFMLYRLSLDNMKAEAVAEYSGLEDSSTATPQIDSLRVVSDDLMHGLIIDGSKITVVTLQKQPVNSP